MTRVDRQKTQREQLLKSNDVDSEQRRIQAKVDLVRRLVEEDAADPGHADPVITTVEDLYDAKTGLPR